MKVSKTLNQWGKALDRHSPELRVGFGIAGMLAGTGLAIRVTPKAVRLMDGKKEELKVEKLPVGETVKTVWKCYLPVVIVEGLSALSIVSGTKTSLRRAAAACTAYEVARATLDDYREAVVDVVGEKKKKDVDEKVAEHRLERNSVENSNVVILPNDTKTLCYDSAFGRYFHSDMESIKRAVNAVNRMAMNENYISLNDFYDEINSPDLEYAELGSQLGWNFEDGIIDVIFTSKLTPTGVPCLSISYTVAPKYDFSSFS